MNSHILVTVLQGILSKVMTQNMEDSAYKMFHMVSLLMGSSETTSVLNPKETGKSIYTTT